MLALSRKLVKSGSVDNIVLCSTILILTGLNSAILSFSEDLKFIVLSFACLYFMKRSMIKSNKITVKLTSIDLSWICFVVLSCLSYFWAVDVSLVWTQSMGWFILIGWVIWSKQLFLKNNIAALLHKYLVGLFFVYLSVSLIGVILQVSTDAEWVRFFGNNSNYTSSFLIALFPFVLFLPKKKEYNSTNLIIWLGSIVTILLVIYYCSVRAVLLAFLISIFLKFYLDRRYKYLLVTLVIISIFAAIIYSPISNLLFGNSGLVSDIQHTDNMSRWYLIKSSFRLFLENPILGIGSGNWHIEAYKYSLTDISPFNSPDFLRHLDHNLYFTRLAELGVFGFSLLFIPIIYFFLKLVPLTHQFSQIEKAFFTTIVVYLVTSMYYGSTSFRDSHFSGLQWLAFTGFGILSNRFRYIKLDNIVFRTFFSLTFLSAFLWFGYAAAANNLIYDGKSDIKNGEIEKGIQKIQKIYNPSLKTSLHTSQSLPYILAQNYEELGAISNASTFYKSALEHQPYNASILYDYASLLFFDMNELNRSGLLLQRLLEIDSLNSLTNILYSQVLFAKGDYIQMRNCLNRSYHPWHTYRVNILEQALYKTNYLTNQLKVKVSPDLKESLSEFEPLSNFELMQNKPWTEINSAVVRSIYKFEFSMYNYLDSLDYNIYLRDRLEGRVSFELKKLQEELDISYSTLNNIKYNFSEYAIQLERLNVNNKLKRKNPLLNKEWFQQVLFENIATKLSEEKLQILKRRISNYNFGKFLFCTEQ